MAGSLRAQTGSAVLAMSSGGYGGQAGTYSNETIVVNGKQRKYRLVVPTSVLPGTPAPLVFAFHGMFDSKDLMPLYTFLDFLAYENKFILVYPNGNGGSWPLLAEWATEDLAFFDSLYAGITSKHNVDLNRVYLTGMSIGGVFTHMVASQRADKIAAIAAHSASMGFLQFNTTPLPRKYAVLAIHGGADPIVSIQESRKTKELYTRWGHAAEILEVANLGHFWAHQIDVNKKMWAFFTQHPR